MYQEGINQIWNLGKKTISQNVTCPILINFHDVLHSFSFKANLLAFFFFLCIFIHSFLIFNPISVLLAFCFQDFLLLHYSYFIPISVYHFPFFFSITSCHPSLYPASFHSISFNSSLSFSFFIFIFTSSLPFWVFPLPAFSSIILHFSFYFYYSSK